MSSQMSKQQTNAYRGPQWEAFRQQIIEADGYCCVRCGREAGDIVLQVHHKQYYPGRALWDYPPGHCETLCSGCHAREHGIVRPDEGWSYAFDEDLGELDGACDVCSTALRYRFYISDP